MTDKERIDDAYERIDMDTDEILMSYDGECFERCLKSIWDSTVTMHQIATVALKENDKLRELVRDAWGNGHPDKSCGDCEIMDECHEHMKNSPPFERCLFEVRIEERMRKLGVTDD